MNLAEDIRLGRISAYLVYPFDFWQFHTAGFIAFQVIQLFVALLTFIVLLGFGIFENFHASSLFSGLVFASLVGWLWFAIQYLLGLMAFWLEETWILRVIVATVSQFFSGAIVPLEFFPEWLRSALQFTPFPYMTYWPVKILMGEFSGLLMPVTILCFWLFVLTILCYWLWKKGLSMYTAAGM